MGHHVEPDPGEKAVGLGFRGQVASSALTSLLSVSHAPPGSSPLPLRLCAHTEHLLRYITHSLLHLLLQDSAWVCFSHTRSPCDLWQIGCTEALSSSPLSYHQGTRCVRCVCLLLLPRRPPFIFSIRWLRIYPSLARMQWPSSPGALAYLLWSSLLLPSFTTTCLGCLLECQGLPGGG